MPTESQERRLPGWLWMILPFVVWLWLCFPLLAGWQVIGFRDAPNWYQPAWEWVDQQPWRWDTAPWNPWDGAGAPLAADPTIALFYPPRWLMRLPVGTHLWRFSVFLALHVLMACTTAGLLARRLGCSPAGCAVAAMAYGLGGTVLFQVTNPIYLVGAAWLPLALAGGWSVSRIETRGREGSRGFLLASAALSTMVLGGDVQLAYLGLLITGVTCWGNWWKALRTNRKATRNSVTAPACPANPMVNGPAVGADDASRTDGATEEVRGPQSRVVRHVALTPTPLPPPQAKGGEEQEVARTMGWRLLLTPLGLGLAVGWLSLAQIWPSAEFARFSRRFSESHPQTVYDVAGTLFREGWSAAGRDAAALLADPPPGTHAEQVYQFSQVPWSILELFLPGFSGYPWPANTRWLDGLPSTDRMWNVSLYPRALVMILAAFAIGRCRRSQDWWMAGIGLLGFLGALGWFGLGWAIRESVAAAGLSNESTWLGRPTGGVYWLLVTLLPGMSGFRYPAKLFVLTAIALAVLAGRMTSHLDYPAKQSVIRWATIAAGLAWLLLAFSGVGQAMIDFVNESSPAESELSAFVGQVQWKQVVAELDSAARWAGGILVIPALIALFLKSSRTEGMTAVYCLALAVDLAICQSRLLPLIPYVSPAPSGFGKDLASERIRQAGYRLILTDPAPTRLDNDRPVPNWMMSDGLVTWHARNCLFKMPRHHWRYGFTRLDSPIAMQPASQWLPVLGIAPFETHMQHHGSFSHSGGIHWCEPSVWTMPGRIRERMKTPHQLFVPRVFFFGQMEGTGRSSEDRSTAQQPAASGASSALQPVMPSSPYRLESPEETRSLLVSVPGPGTIQIELTAGESGFLAFPEAWCGGWGFRIAESPDSLPVTAAPSNWQPVDVVARRVPVPAGSTSVQLRYRPRSWRTGIAISAAGWLSVLLLSAVAGVQRKKSQLEQKQRWPQPQGKF